MTDKAPAELPCEVTQADDLDAILFGLEEVQRARRSFVQARDAMNAARPIIDASPAERALYNERYKADREAQRELYRVAHTFAEAAASGDYAKIIADRTPATPQTSGDPALQELKARLETWISKANEEAPFGDLHEWHARIIHARHEIFRLAPDILSAIIALETELTARSGR